MKLTVITGARGKIIGAFHGHGEARPVEGRLTARLVAGPGQKFHEIDVPDNVMPSEPTPADLARLPQLLKTYLRKR